MLEGTLSVYAFLLLFPISVIFGLLFLIRNYVRSTEFCDKDARFDGKTIVITGGSSGIGYALSKELCKRGARVIVACRTQARRDSTAFFLRSKTGSFNLKTMYMDLTSLDSVYEFCRELASSEEKIDGIVCNAGILMSGQQTADELDLIYGVNFIGHFLMINLLLEKLLSHGKQIAPVKVINVACTGFRYGHIPSADEMQGIFQTKTYPLKDAYRSSKLALYLFTKKLAKDYLDEGIVTYSVDPGYVNSNLYRHLEGYFGKFNQTMAEILYRTTEEGIQTIMHCLYSKEILRDTGKLFKDCRIQDVRNSDWTDTNVQDLCSKTEELIKSKGFSLTISSQNESEAEDSQGTE